MNKYLMKTCIICLFAFSISAQETAHLSDRINQFLNDGTQNGFAGSVIVRVKGETIIANGYGLAEKQSNKHNTLNTVFDIGSNTKQFTGAAILKLVEQGKLSIAQKLSDFFKNLPKDKTGITVQHLLAHESGLIESIGGDFSHTSEKDFFDQVFATQLEFKPGEKYSYSNIGYSILAKIIEISSGQSYEGFLNHHFFKPLKMKQTGYLLPEWQEANLANGYPRDIVDTGSMVARYREDKKVSWHLLGNGGINATPNDMLKWIHGLKNHVVLSKASFQKLVSQDHSADKGDNGRSFSYSYGWGLRKTKSNKIRLSHNGSNSRFAHSIIWYPESDDLILFATNTDSPELERVAHQIDKAIQSADYSFTPILKNPYKFVFDFMERKTPEQSEQLLEALKSNYPNDLKTPTLLNRIGMMLLRQDRVDWSIILFEYNAALFPADGNLRDSLGEAYFKKGQIEKATLSFKKAIALGANGNCHWCENSKARLDAMMSKK